MEAMREKLIELLETVVSPKELLCDGEVLISTSRVADHLIANGVTVQEWISVTERLPERDVLVLCVGARGGMFLGECPHLFSDGTAYFSVPNARRCRYATHWMPLPPPPKGE